MLGAGALLTVPEVCARAAHEQPLQEVSTLLATYFPKDLSFTERCKGNGCGDLAGRPPSAHVGAGEAQALPWARAPARKPAGLAQGPGGGWGPKTPA